MVLLKEWNRYLKSVASKNKWSHGSKFAQPSDAVANATSEASIPAGLGGFNGTPKGMEPLPKIRCE